MRIAVLALALAFGATGAARADQTRIYTEEALGFTNLANAGGHTNGATAGGSALFAFYNRGPQFQISGDVAGLSGTGGASWDINGDLFWRDDKGTFGGTFSYAKAPSSFGSMINVNGYGAFGEWYFNRDVTLRLSGVHFSGHGENANTISGGALFYITRSLAFDLNGSYGTTHLADTARAGASVEYMFKTLPLSIAAGGSYNAEGGNGHELFIALKFRTGPASDLEDFQRRGPLDWDGGVSPTSVL